MIANYHPLLLCEHKHLLQNTLINKNKNTTTAVFTEDSNIHNKF